MQQEGLFKEMKLRRHYEKPSVKKKRIAAEVLRRKRKFQRRY
jgi:small subunit ribosomal protein S21